MYTVIRHHNVKGPEVDELARQGKEDFVPIIKQMDGFVSYSIVTSEDLVTTISVFESKEAAEESTRKAIAWAANHVTEFEVPTEVIQGEVFVHELR